MAAAVTIIDKISLGATDWLYIGTFQFDSSYPTGGEAIDLTGATGIPGPSKLKAFWPQFPTAGAALPKYDAANQKLKLITAIAGTEVADTTDESAVIVPFIAIGPGGA